MGKINNVFSNAPQAANKFNGSNGKREPVKLEFEPRDIGAARQGKSKQYPATIKITETAAEAALLKKFGFDTNNPADVARVKQLLQTEGSPFAALVTTGNLTAAYNNRTGKYEIINSVEKNLYKQLQGKAAEVKTQIEREKQSAAPNSANPNELIAGKNGITNNSRAALENKLNNQPSISASNRNESEKAVKTITGAIESVTGTTDPFAGSEVGKQFNRLSVSSLRLTGKALELSNYFSEKINDAVRSVAPDAVDDLLNQADKINRENARALQNAGSAVTSEDTFIDQSVAQSGHEIPLTEDLARKIMYFPEAIPNAIDSAVKGDFKADDGSYSDKVGKIIGGLNPAGDVRDITANGKKVIEGDGKATIPLIASIVGGIPGAGDVAKPIIKEVGEELTEKAIKETSGETVEKIVKEEATQLIKQTGKLEIEAGRTLTDAEKRFAEKEVADGKHIIARKEVNEYKVKNPDFEINGEIVEFKYVSDLKGVTADKLSARLSSRMLDGGSQASKVTLDVTDQVGMTKEIADRAVSRAFGNQRFRGVDKLKEVRIYGKDFDITILFISTK